MEADARKFMECLDDARSMLENYPGVNYTRVDQPPGYPQPEHFHLTVFEKWADFCELGFERKAPIRIIQHFSCTGGTLIAKCVAALPNVSVLSEVNPFSQLRWDSIADGFAPTDLTYLSSRSDIPLRAELAGSIFRAGIGAIARHLRYLGRHLVIREHSHSDYLVGERPRKSSAVRELLQDDHPLLPVLTVRHPVDSYLSLHNNGWTHFTPNTFDEYCRRYLLFLEHNESVPRYRYEDFVANPPDELQRMAKTLELPFNKHFLDLFDLMKLSGDSGRASSTIAPRPRRKTDDGFRRQVAGSSRYRELCERLAYPVSIDP